MSNKNNDDCISDRCCHQVCVLLSITAWYCVCVVCIILLLYVLITYGVTHSLYLIVCSTSTHSNTHQVWVIKNLVRSFFLQNLAYKVIPLPPYHFSFRLSQIFIFSWCGHLGVINTCGLRRCGLIPTEGEEEQTTTYKEERMIPRLKPFVDRGYAEIDENDGSLTGIFQDIASFRLVTCVHV